MIENKKEGALAEEVSFSTCYITELERQKSVQLLHQPVLALLRIALQSESLISGLEIARPFCY
jgi:hypothetical protein